jgi:hypothetical protein|tara:strand:+ start:73 stop:462 length:390 start_codon:yes stop_codon:yes gene_type:complete
MKLIIREENAFFTDTLEIERVKKGGIAIVGSAKKGRGAPARNYTDAKGVVRGTVSAPAQEAVKADKTAGIKAQKRVWYDCDVALDIDGKPVGLPGMVMSDSADVLLDGKTLSKLMPKSGKAKGRKNKAA